MSTIIELLAVEGGTIFFTVDKTKDKVILSYPAEPIFRNTENLYWFDAGDNFQLLSYIFVLPMCFRFYTRNNINNYIKLEYQEDGIGIKRDFAKLFLPFENYEMNSGNFYNFATALPDEKTKFKLLGSLNQDMEISMYNVPDDLEGVSFPVQVFIKVRHNLPLK